MGGGPDSRCVGRVYGADGRTGNLTRDLMISSQRPWPLDHEAGQIKLIRYISY